MWRSRADQAAVLVVLRRVIIGMILAMRSMVILEGIGVPRAQPLEPTTVRRIRGGRQTLELQGTS